MAGDVREIAQQIKAAVTRATGLTCSIGLSWNKRLAKIASDQQKPNGLTVITEADIPDRIWPLNVKEVNGIGPKAAATLNGLGVFTIGDLAHADPALLQEHFGRSYCASLLDAANGIDDRPVVTHAEPNSMSCETTFERDLHPKMDRPVLTPAFTELCNRVAADLQRKGYVGTTISIKVRFTGFHTVTRDYTVDRPTDDATVIRRCAGECLKRINLDRRISLLGVRVTGLTKKGRPCNRLLPSPTCSMRLPVASCKCLIGFAVVPAAQC